MTARSTWRSAAAARTFGGGLLWVAALVLASRTVAGFGAPVVAPGGFAIRADLIGVISGLAALIAGANFFPAAWRAVARVRLDMNVLMTMAIVAAIAIGEPVEAATLAVLFSFAELLERAAVQRGRHAITKLLELAPEEAEVVHADGSTTRRAARTLDVGERIRVRPGGRIAVDGVVVAGESSVNESTITGESLPAYKGVGAAVFAGTLNFDGALDVEVRAAAGASTLDRIVAAVRAAEGRRAPVATLVDRFSRVYTPIVTLLALLVAVVPLVFGAEDPHTWFLRGVTLLVIACPCALVIATPVTVVSALTSAARRGVLIKGGMYLEALAAIRALAVDKTGTLTTGVLEVATVEVRPPARTREVLRLLAAIESRSEHPTARALVHHAGALGIASDAPVATFESSPGRGVQGAVAGTSVRIGTETFVGENATRGWTPAPADVTTVYAATSDGAHARITMRDSVRAEAASVIRELHALGVRPVVMLTGDAEPQARAVADATGVDEARARLLPEDKVLAVRALAERYHGIAMLGDGVNDAPALATATVGVVMGAAGAPATIETADVALMRDDLHGLPYAIRLSRRAMRTIRFNLVVAVLVKVLLAAGTVAGVVSLTAAVLVGDVGGTLLVTLNALRLARDRPTTPAEGMTMSRG